MKKISYILFLLFLLSMQGCKPREYVINGDVTDIPDGTTVYLRLVGPPNRDIDSTVVENGKFSFTGSHDSIPAWALIAVKGRFTPLCDFYLENGNIDLTGSVYSTRATGTETNAQYNFYNDSVGILFNDITRVHTSIRIGDSDAAEQTDSLKSVLKQLEKEVLDREVKFVKDYPDSPISLRIVEYISRDASSDDIMEYVSCLSERQQALAEPLKEFAQRKRKTEDGAVAPAFTLNDENGNSVSLSDYKGKYVLVDFWASWCAPCRASFPLVKELYTRYAGDDFDILGLSLDRSDEAWRKALEQEDCPWTQVVDLEGVVANEYAVSSIPMMLLIAPDGTILGKYRQTTIGEKLAELFDAKS